MEKVSLGRIDLIIDVLRAKTQSDIYMEIELIKEILELEDLWVEIDPEWSSRHSSHRENLRQAVVMRLTLLLERDKLGKIYSKVQALGELKALLNTSLLPVTTFSSQSISHCQEMGGFAITLQPTQIGFDIEPLERINAKAAPIARVSKEEELTAAPSAGHLWVGKEATFKALVGTRQPKVLSEIYLSHWQQCSEHIYRFRFDLSNFKHLAPSGLGVVITSDCLKMGLAVI